MDDDDNSDNSDNSSNRNPVIERALREGFKSGGDIGDIGGGTGEKVESSGGGRGGRGSGTRSEARRTGSAARAAKQAAQAGLEGTAAQQIVQQQRQEAEKRVEQQKKIAVRKKQREIAQQKIGTIERIRRNRQGEVSFVGKEGIYTFPSESRLTFSPEQDERLRGGSSLIGTRERLNEAALKRQERKQAEFVEEYTEGVEQRFIGTKTKQLQKQAEEASRKEMEQRLKTAPLQVKEQLQQKPIKQTIQKTTEVNIPLSDNPTATISVATAFYGEQLTEKDFDKGFLRDTYFAETDIGKATLEFGKGVTAFTIDPAKDITGFFQDLGVGSVKTGEELAELVKADNEKTRKQVKQNIKNIGKETFLTKKAATTATIGTLIIIPPVISKSAFIGLAAFETKKFIEKPSFERTGRLVTLVAISKTPKIIKGIKRKYYDFRLSRSGLTRIKAGTFDYRQPALEPKTMGRNINKKGQITKTFSDFKLSKTDVIRNLAVMPQTGRPIVTTQARLKPLATAGLLEFTGQAPKEFIIRQKDFPTKTPNLFLEGLGYRIDAPTKKVTVLDFPKPKPTKTRLPEFILQTKPKQQFFEIKEGELQGIKYPLYKETRFIRLKPFKDLGTDKLTFKTTPKKSQQLTIKSFTGEQLPSEFLFIEKPNIDRSMKPFSRPKPLAKAKEQFIDVESGGLVTKQKIKAPKIETFAGDVQFKEPSVRFPETKAPSVSIEKTFTAPFSLAGVKAGEKVDIFTGTKRKRAEIIVPIIDLGIKTDLGLDIGLRKDIRSRFKQEEISISEPKIDTSIDITPKTDINIRQDIGRDIGFPIIPDLDIPEIPEPEIPGPPPPQPPPEEPTDKPPTPFRFNLDLGMPRKRAMPAYHAFAVFKGRKTRLTEKPLPKNKAFNRMSEFVDSTSSIRGSIKKSQKKTQSRDTFYRRAEFKFKKKGNNYIEKKQYQKDSVQERGLSPVGFIKKNKVKWF